MAITTDIIRLTLYNPDTINWFIEYSAADTSIQPFYSNFGYPVTIGALDIPNLTFPTLAAAQAYLDPIASAAVIANITLNTGVVWVAGSIVSFTTQDNLNRLNAAESKLTALQKTTSVASRAVDVAFQVSTTQATLAVYTGQIVATSSLSGGQLGSCVLEIANDSAFTLAVTEVCRITNGNTGTLVIGLNLVQTFAAPMVGVIPAGKWARIRSLDTTGAPVQSYVSGQETQF